MRIANDVTELVEARLFEDQPRYALLLSWHITDELVANLRTSHPAVRTIILTTFARPGYLRRALDAGARGYLLKDRVLDVASLVTRRYALADINRAYEDIETDAVGRGVIVF